MKIPTIVNICGIKHPVEILPSHLMGGNAGIHSFLPTRLALCSEGCDTGLTHNQLSTLAAVLYQVITINNLDFRNRTEVSHK